MDDKPPPARRLELKPKDIIPSDSASRPGDGTEISVPLMLRENRLAEARAAGARPLGSEPGPPDAGEHPGPSSPFRAKEITPVDPPSPAGDPEAIRVDDILRQNRIAAHESEPRLIAMPVRRRSRRNRDFTVILAMAAIIGGGLALVFRQNGQVAALALTGVAFLTLILAWILYGVMDNY